MHLVLASASPRRRELIADLGVDFDVRPADVDESSVRGSLSPSGLARTLALRKARAVADKLTIALPVVGADTIVVLDGEALGKPTNEERAREVLERLRGRTHEVVTGVVVIAHGREASRAATTVVTMREYSADEVVRYIARGEPYDKAGGYGIQDPEFAPAASVDGCTCSVVGLPLWTVRRMLWELCGIETREPSYERCESCPLRARG